MAKHLSKVFVRCGSGSPGSELFSDCAAAAARAGPRRRALARAWAVKLRYMLAKKKKNGGGQTLSSARIRRAALGRRLARAEAHNADEKPQPMSVLRNSPIDCRRPRWAALPHAQASTVNTREHALSGYKNKGTWKLNKNGFCTTWQHAKRTCFTVIPNGENKWSVRKGANGVATWTK